MENTKNGFGLVLEGGAHRGIYTAGVLDVLYENGLVASGVIGVSAGAIHGASYMSGQVGRSIRYTEKYCGDKRYMGFGSLLRTGDFFNSDFCYRQLPEVLDPYDNEALERAQSEFYVVCTNVQSGKAEYKKLVSLRGENMLWLQASASMPLAAKPIYIEGTPYLDGGIADSIPLKAFEDLGYGRNIVVLTQCEGFVKRPNALLPLISIAYRKHPNCVATNARRHIVYNESLAYVEERAKSGCALVLRPSKDVKVSRIESDPRRIRAMYELGRSDALARLGEIRAFAQV